MTCQDSINTTVKRKGNNSLNTEKFIIRSRAKHGERYDYSKSIYTTAKEKLIIICKIHGEFEQEAYSHMIGCGCPKCKKNYQGTRDSFIVSATKVHGARYDYSDVIYVKSELKVKIRCGEHGLFEQQPSNHLMGKGCEKCGFKSRKELKTFPFDEFERISNIKHGSKYSYIKESYNGIKSNIDIICRYHGVFSQQAKNHMNGNICPQCLTNSPGFTKTRFKKHCDSNKGNGIIYIIKCFNSDEMFFKIGITSQSSVSKRFDSKARMPYNYNVVESILLGASSIYDLEKSLHKILKYYKYKPKIQFGGHSECFSFIPKNVLSMMSKMKSSPQLQLIV